MELGFKGILLPFQAGALIPHLAEYHNLSECFLSEVFLTEQNQTGVSSVLRTVIHSDIWVPGTPIHRKSIVSLGSVVG